MRGKKKPFVEHCSKSPGAYSYWLGCESVIMVQVREAGQWGDGSDLDLVGK